MVRVRDGKAFVTFEPVLLGSSPKTWSDEAKALDKKERKKRKKKQKLLLSTFLPGEK